MMMMTTMMMVKQLREPAPPPLPRGQVNFFVNVFWISTLRPPTILFKKRHLFVCSQAPPQLPVEYAMWGPRGASIAYVFGANIYYRSTIQQSGTKEYSFSGYHGWNIKDSLFPRETPESLDVMVTQTGRPGVVFNGVADWVYEEEVWSAVFTILHTIFATYLRQKCSGVV